MSIGLLLSLHFVVAEELSFIKNNPTLNAKLLTWEEEASGTLKAQIKSLREDNAIGKASTAIAIRKHPETAQGAILALIETLNDFSGLQWGGGYTSNRTSPAAEAWKTLGKIGKPAIGPLIAALKDEEGNIRNGAARALGEIGDPEAVEELIQTLKDSNDLVRISSAKALGDIKDSRAIEPLISALSDTRVNVRKEAVIALGKFKDPRIADGLTIALIDKESRVQQEAIKILGSQQTFDLIIPFTKDKNSEIRKAAIKVLGDLKNPNVVDYIIIALKDEDKEVRTRAAYILGSLKDPSVVEPLINALKDKENNVSSAAISALRKIKDPRAVEPILESLKNKYSGLRIGETSMSYTAKTGDSFSQITAQLFGNAHLWTELRDMYNEQNPDNQITSTLIEDGHKLTFEIRGELAQLLRPELWGRPVPSKQLKSSNENRSPSKTLKSSSNQEPENKGVGSVPDPSSLVSQVATVEPKVTFSTKAKILPEYIEEHKPSERRLKMNDNFPTLTLVIIAIFLFFIGAYFMIKEFLKMGIGRRLKLKTSLDKEVGEREKGTTSDRSAQSGSLTASDHWDRTITAAENDQRNDRDVCEYSEKKDAQLDDRAQEREKVLSKSESTEKSYEENIFRGGFDEPYCSETCYGKAGGEIAARCMQGASGVCAFCQQSVSASFGNPGGTVLFPFKNQLFFICASCSPKGKDYVSSLDECCMCGKTLE